MSESQSANGCGRDLPQDTCADKPTSAIIQSSADSKGNSDIIAKIIAELITNRAQGNHISDEQVIASHPELMPNLREELLGVGELHKAIMLGQGHGTSNSQFDASNEVPRAKPEGAETVPGGTDPHKGLRLQGYLIEREISSGGQATVFKAVQERTGRAVAVKLMHGGPYVGVAAGRDLNASPQFWLV